MSNVLKYKPQTINKISMSFLPDAVQAQSLGMKVLDVDFSTKTFSDGSVQVNLVGDSVALSTLTESYRNCAITAYIGNMDDLMIVAQLKELANRLAPLCAVRLNLISPTYTRYDRVMLDGGVDAFSLKCYANFINSLGFAGVLTFDVHSDVTTQLVQRSVNYPTLGADRKVMGIDLDKVTLVAPDKGALKKMPFAPVVFDKVRDLSSSNITSYELVKCKALFDLPNDFLVVDDICDGGRTFINLAESFREKFPQANSLSLYITHGIFCHDALDRLTQVYDKVLVAFIRESVYNSLSAEVIAKLVVKHVVLGV